MPERQRTRRGPATKARDTVEKKMTEARKHAEHDVGLLDNPAVADEPSEIRHLAYFGIVIAFALVLNLVLLLVVAGGP